MQNLSWDKKAYYSFCLQFDNWVLKKEEYIMWENAFSEQKKKETLL